MLLTSGIPAGIPIDMTKLTKNVRSRFVLLYKEFNHGMLMK
jgi:hypothetical protein